MVFSISFSTISISPETLCKQHNQQPEDVVADEDGGGEGEGLDGEGEENKQKCAEEYSCNHNHL